MSSIVSDVKNAISTISSGHINVSVHLPLGLKITLAILVGILLGILLALLSFGPLGLFPHGYLLSWRFSWP